ncbi:Uncharacterised protein [Klebsiella pneumoniae]|uniref:Uncharacterized protein n=1 Tax=Klebsiella pneumoniae TaxID=573 RepID=A0A2X3CTC1_KLEPN|nr:Uncharacterised protein [Klebsiella pneumoniae]
MAMVNENIVIRLAQDVDIPEVKQLLERYHAKNLAGEQRANGFVTTDMTEQQLSELSSAESGVVIALIVHVTRSLVCCSADRGNFSARGPCLNTWQVFSTNIATRGKNWMQ